MLLWVGGGLVVLLVLMVVALVTETPEQRQAREATRTNGGGAARPIVLPFTIAKSEQTSLPDRLRWSVEAVMPGEGTSAAVVATCAEIVRQTLRERRSAQAAVVFAYYLESEVGKGYTRCRATASRDGRGWMGDGIALDGGPDGNTVKVDLASTAISSEGQRLHMGIAETLRLPR